MKRTFFVLIISSIFFLLSCSKNVSGGIEKTDKVAQLFQQVKEDPKYIEYCKMMILYRDAFMANGKKSVENKKRTGQSDSTLLQNNNIPLEQRYKQLGYDNYEVITANAPRMYELQKYMNTTYPLLGELTQEEGVKFAKISTNYIKSISN